MAEAVFISEPLFVSLNITKYLTLHEKKHDLRYRTLYGIFV